MCYTKLWRRCVVVITRRDMVCATQLTEKGGCLASVNICDITFNNIVIIWGQLAGHTGQRGQLAAGAGLPFIGWKKLTSKLAEWLKEGLRLAGLGLRSEWATCIKTGVLPASTFTAVHDRCWVIVCSVNHCGVWLWNKSVRCATFINRAFVLAPSSWSFWNPNSELQARRQHRRLSITCRGDQGHFRHAKKENDHF